MDPDIEILGTEAGTLCYVIRGSIHPAQTTFVTPPDSKQQVGFIVYPAGGSIARHTHRNLERRIHGMSEVLVVRTGRCRLLVYDQEHQLRHTREVSTGDVIVLVAGGHGFEVLEDTVFLEIKQGPYQGQEDKELF
jgi:anti-sigma factor ChrR (cupin superfamily)